jgi:hypothetical protein
VIAAACQSAQTGRNEKIRPVKKDRQETTE